MINLYQTNIEQLSIHQVGNKSKAEGCFVSDSTTELNDEIAPLVKDFFFRPFREKEEVFFNFSHEVDVAYNEVFKTSESIFNNPNCFHEKSKDIVGLLYNESMHPHIKGGEVYVTYLDNVIIDNQKVNAIGIFKSELKHDFLQFENKGKNMETILQQGVNLKKLDKGCIIFNIEKESGYRVLSVDSNKYDTKYWLNSFLGLDAVIDDAYQTKKYLQLCQNFAKDVVFPAEDKKEEVMFMNRSMDYFAKNDEFEETEYLNVVVENPDLIPEFKHYKSENEQKYSVEDLTQFPISNTAVTTSRKKIKNEIKLDTNMSIKLDFINPDSAEKFLEKGWDEEKQMYYYLCYFNKEEK